MEKTKKNFFKSITFRLLLTSVLPILLLIIGSAVVAAISLTQSLEETSLEGLRNMAVAVRAANETYIKGDYYLDETGSLWKGETNITMAQAAMDNFVSGTDVDVTVFYGDVRKATSLKDAKTGERIVGTQASAEVAAKVLAGAEYSSNDVVINGKDYFAYYIPMYNTDGSIVGMVFAGEPQEDVDMLINKSINQVILIELILFAVAIIFTVISARMISKQIIKAKEGVDALADGDLTFKMDESTLKRADEIGDMARSVDSCSKKLTEIVSGIQETAHSVLNAGDTLSNMAGQTSQSADDISTAVTDISKGAVAQAEDIETATSSVSHMGDVIESIVDNIMKLHDASDAMAHAGDDATQIMSELADSNDKTSEAVLRVAQNVELTDRSVQKIAEAARMITSVAEQTTLLSLNASIEAARAGEAGRGFAVVSTEIQKLSDESSSSAQTIEEILKELTTASRNSLEVMEEVKARLKEQQAKLEETERCFGNVSDGITASKQGADSISGQADACDQSRKDVMDIINNLSAISEENAASTEETTASMEELNATISLVANSAEQLKDMAVELEELTQFFKL